MVAFDCGIFYICRRSKGRRHLIFYCFFGKIHCGFPQKTHSKDCQTYIFLGAIDFSFSFGYNMGTTFFFGIIISVKFGIDRLCLVLHLILLNYTGITIGRFTLGLRVLLSIPQKILR